MGAARSRNTSLIDIVLDLDHTLVYVDFSQTDEASQSCVMVRNPNYLSNIPYGLVPWSLEFLRALFQKQREGLIRVSFYSTGEKWRNEQLVPILLQRAMCFFAGQRTTCSPKCQTMLSNDSEQDCDDAQLFTEKDCNIVSSCESIRSTTSTATIESFSAKSTQGKMSRSQLFGSWLRQPESDKHLPRILSKNSLDEYGRKDLRKVHRDLRLERAILVDDNHTTASGQDACLLKVPSFHTVHANCDQYSAPQFSPSSMQSSATSARTCSRRIQQSLVRAMGIILLSLSLSSSQNININEAMRKVLQSGESKNVYYVGFSELIKYSDSAIPGSATL